MKSGTRLGAAFPFGDCTKLRFSVLISKKFVDMFHRVKDFYRHCSKKSLLMDKNKCERSSQLVNVASPAMGSGEPSGSFLTGPRVGIAAPRIYNKPATCGAAIDVPDSVAYCPFL